MIFVIGGAARAGKTTLARRLEQELRVAGSPTDAIVWMLQSAAPELGIGFPIVPENADAAIPFVIAHAQALSMRGARDLVVEGVAVLPRHVHRMEAAFPAGVECRAVFLGQEQATPASIAVGGGWAAQGDAEERSKWARQTREVSAVVRQECIDLGLPYFDVGADWGAALESALITLTGGADSP